MAILNNNPLVGASGNQGGYNINNSLRFRSSASAYLNRTPASAGNRRTWTWSGWVKFSEFSGNFGIFYAAVGTGYARIDLGSITDSTISVIQYNGSTYDFQIATSQVFRDPSAWYHIIIAFDTTQATNTNRVKVYVNGTQVTNFGTTSWPTLNFDAGINNNVVHNIGRSANFGPMYFSGYLAEVNFIDGSAKTPSDFGETDTTTGVWKPKAYTGTYGTNGFYLKFSDIATTSGSNAGLGKDFSGNSNYWTTNNISVTSGVTYDAMTDSPTLTSATVANYAVLNPLQKYYTNATLSNGNLNFSGGTSGIYALSTINISTGKWYCEFVFTTISGASSVVDCGFLVPGGANAVYYKSDGLKGLTSGESAYGASYTINDVIGMAVDFETKNVTFYKNGTSQGTFSFSTESWTGDWAFHARTRGTTTYAGNINFGQRPFSYTPPTGYVALNTYNLPTPTILQGNKYMDATLYTGTNVSNTIVNQGQFKPDLVWIKSRSVTGANGLTDSVRGRAFPLFSNSTDAEGTSASDKDLISFNSNGFTVGIGNQYNSNGSGNTLVGWQWQAGQGSTSSNTSGTITSTVSVNTTAGFSIVTYTGTGANATVGHGLGVAPKMVIAKGRNTTSADHWRVYHTSLGGTQVIMLNLTNAASSSSVYWNNTNPTSSVFSLGTDASINENTKNFVAYCWAEIAGFSAFGSYTGNGSTDGPFIFTGFRPKFIMIKCTSNADSWYMLDTSRSTYNATNQRLFANASSAESSGDAMDILSNGFKNRSNTTINNLNGGTYIYMAFAENPFKNSLAR